MTIFFRFWSRYPALLYGLYFSAGIALAFDLVSPLLLLPLLPLTAALNIRFLLAFLLGIAAYLWILQTYHFPSSETLEKNGIAEIEIVSISQQKNLFGEQVRKYEIFVKNFFDKNGDLLASHFPARLTISPDRFKQVPATFDYQVEGKFKQNKQGTYIFKLQSGSTWIPIKKGLGIAEYRFIAKQKMREYIYKFFQNPHVGAFLAGMATGEFDDQFLSHQLGRFGLQHLMAISGLHFSILASILGLGLSLFLSNRLIAVGVVFTLSTYFIFLGNSPSVMRAWIGLMIATVGVLIGRKNLALNSLGVAIIVTLLLNPLAIQQIGFQFSFGITAAILLFFDIFDQLLLKLFQRRSLSQVVAFDWIDQHAYCFMVFLRQTLALTLAVNLIALPMTLFYFQKFPWMGLIYNLFFPCMVSMSMFLLLAGLITISFFPLLGTFFNELNNYYTQFLLNFTFHLPATFDFNLYVAEFSSEWLLGYFFLLLAGAIYIHASRCRYNEGPSWMV